MTKSRVIVLILTILAIGSIAALIGWSASMKRVFGEEAYELFLQFSLITVVGGLISAVFSELKRESESREARRQSIRSFHATAVSAYNRAKKLRRLMTPLALHVVNGKTRVRRSEYWKLMAEMEDVQLEFESMKRQVDVSGDLFGGAAKEIKAALKSIEKYLRKAVKEFEEEQFSDDGKEPKLSDFKELEALIDDNDKPDGFVVNCSKPYDAMEKALLRLTLR